MKSLQYFTDEYLNECKKMSAREILDFIENFRRLVSRNNQDYVAEKTILISLKVPENLLKSFRIECEKSNIKYQSQIKVLMRDWIDKG